MKKKFRINKNQTVVLCVNRSLLLFLEFIMKPELNSMHQDRSILVNQILRRHNMFFSSLFFAEVQTNTPFPYLACLVTKGEEKRPKHILRLSALLLKKVANRN